MVPRGNQWGIQGALLVVEEGAQAGNAGLGLWIFSDAVRVPWRFSKQAEHAVRPHIYRPLIGVEAIPLVPTDPVKTERERYGEDEGQYKLG